VQKLEARLSPDRRAFNLEILIKQQTAASKKDSVTVTELVPMLQQAAEVGLHNRRSLLEHAAAHNP